MQEWSKISVAEPACKAWETIVALSAREGHNVLQSNFFLQTDANPSSNRGIRISPRSSTAVKSCGVGHPNGVLFEE